MIDDKRLVLNLVDEQASEQLALVLARSLSAPLILSFSGEIGAGKTTLIRAMLRALGVSSAIKSPTFSLLEHYDCLGFSVHHFDLYRIHHEDELEYIGFRDYFSGDSVCCIEWAERAGRLLPHVDVLFDLKLCGAGRELIITSFSTAGERIVASLAGEQ